MRYIWGLFLENIIKQKSLLKKIKGPKKKVKPCSRIRGLNVIKISFFPPKGSVISMKSYRNSSTCFCGSEYIEIQGLHIAKTIFKKRTKLEDIDYYVKIYFEAKVIRTWWSFYEGRIKDQWNRTRFPNRPMWI